MSIQKKAAADPFAQNLGIELLEVKEGYARCTMTVRESMLNFNGITHGGAVFALADTAFAAASNSHGPEALALHISFNFLQATDAGEVLTATAKEDNLTRRTGLYRLEVRDQAKRVVALGEGLVYRRT